MGKKKFIIKPEKGVKKPKFKTDLSQESLPLDALGHRKAIAMGLRSK